jgi:hypothetical protein
MSNQLQVSGAAKIRTIQGPVVANSGVITALDGDATQYVRGDGTLADFPTSTGGGSSVSYYLNTSVSQGTIGGVAYKQLSKTPIAGAGTDVTISANGYIASYITDANDPALLEVPAGNFNCEFYFSVNSNAHNPYVYAELYKYDGTTFTLLGSSQAIPEYLTSGTTLSAYYFAIPVTSSVLTVTDRIAIRIFVNVDTKTVTLHTENNHLCQVVTTFSRGLTILNSLTRQVQFFQTGTSGTDFGISSATATHTFNLPVASASNTGKLSSTDWSTFNNKQNLLTNPVTGTGSDGRVAFWTGASTISSDANLYYDYSTDRLGIGTNTPNASLGILNASSTGIQVRTSDSANQYQANIFYDASYGMVYGYNRLGTGTASNLTFFNNIGGFISIPESATNNIGFNTLNPQGLAGASVYDFTSLNTNVELRLHNSSTGYTSSDGSFIRVTSTALVIANAETSKSILINNGGNGVVTIDGTNKVAIGDIGVIPMTQQLTVVGSIEAYGGSIYQTVTSSMLKANSSGQIIAAIAGTDYLAVGSAVTSVSATSPVLSSGGTTPNISIPAATTSVSGYLTSTDWTTFNNKFTLPSLTQGSILFSDGSTIAQNNNRLYWNNSTMRLGVGSQPVAQYVMYVKANVGENANAWLGIDNDNATGSTAVRLILNGSTTSGFQYVQSTNMTQVYANAGDIQLINGSSLGLTIANTTGNATFSASISATAITGTGLLYANAAESNTLYTGAFFWTPGSYNFFNQKTDHSLVIGTYNSNSPIAAITIAQSGTVTFSNSVTATSFVKTGGTSSQFLKADGSVDSTTYGSVTSVATSAPLTGGTITSSGTIGITQATTSTNGYLSSTDWNTFNNKTTLPSLTSGSVLFSNGSTIAQDNANFFWDDVNNRLGIGTATPEQILHIVGASAIVYIDGNSAGTQTSSTLRLRTGGFNVGNFRYNVATDNIEINNISGGGAVTSGAVKIYGTGGSTTGLTITAAGLVGLGTAIPSGIVNGGGLVVYDALYPRVILQNSTTGTTTSAYSGMYMIGNNMYVQNPLANLYLGTLAGNSVMSITSTGNVGIGTTSPQSALSFASTSHIGVATVDGSDNGYLTMSGGGAIGDDRGASIYMSGNERPTYGGQLGLAAGNAGASGFINFITGGTERMRLHSTGKLTITNNYAGDVTFYSSNTSSTGYGGGIQGGNGGNYSFVVRKYDGTDYFQVRGNGGVDMPVVYSSFSSGNAANLFMGAGGALYVSTSSIKYKKDVRNYDKGLAEVLKMRPVYYKGISDYDGDTQFAGLIAEEIEELGLKEFVVYEEDGSPKSLAYASMVTLLTKAIQELSAKNDALETRLQLLENKII